ncbi:cell envelope integrity protein TolA [Limnohabitans sp. JirII-31]|uniref:cell envelope integrity protein TolA n=1 Tax=Limnohabitans sp. JirII-31 TaxID=1977908 RepID=UPI000C1F5E49|nr:cell envelope integrity protein TolA [Limnohabitans sp. JirII-31]PIT80466.1 protein TolA [Limnohabitans sp. JirII-31]
MSAHAQHLEFAPPPPPGTGRSLTLALFVHALLLVALTAGIQWNQDNPLSAEAELWSAVPQAAAPKLVEVEPPPPPPPAPKEVVKPPPPAPDREADIALAKKRKQLDDEKKLQQAKDAERRQAELKKAEQKKADEKKAKLKAEEDKRQLDAKREEERKDKERKDKEAKKLQAQKEAKQAAEDAKKLEAIRNENMKRIAGLAGATGGDNATGSALRSAGPSDSYGGRIRARIKPNIVFTEEVVGNTPAEVEVRCAPDGTIVGKKLVKSSGNLAWDNAVLKAIDKTEVLPRDVDGRVHSPLLISFRPKD